MFSVKSQCIKGMKLSLLVILLINGVFAETSNSNQNGKIDLHQKPDPLQILEKEERGKVQPNIILVLVDDVGWADFNYNTEAESPIPTPNIDQMAKSGIRFSQHYVHPTCTPTRAALLTGRYSANTGLPFAMYPGSVAGLPAEMATMPQLLREAGYAAHMVGKWHLGHSQPKQSPIGRGFQTHTGTHMWDIESFTKLLWNKPWEKPFGADWVKANENGSRVHLAEPRHATTAITEEAIAVMESHKAESERPLFLYVAHTAAHSPLQPEPEWLEVCTGIPHLWRRQYCGMVVGLDLALGRLVEKAKDILGGDTIVVVSSDNGGSVWFGGLNAPLRSGKHTSFEGGVRVPAFAVDLSDSGNHLGTGGRDYPHMVHISDWLPTFLQTAGKPALVASKGLVLDGMPLLEGIRTGAKVRTSVLLDLYTATDSHDGGALVAYRKGDYKVIQGSYKDAHWYSEPEDDKVSSTDIGIFPRILEKIARFLDWSLGEGPCDSIRMLFFNIWLFNYYASERGSRENTLLFNIAKDPEEKRNIAPEFGDIVSELLKEAEIIKAGRPYTPRYWMVSSNWTEGFVEGDCSGQDVLPSEFCRFTGPWLPDSADLRDEEALGLKDIAAEATREMRNQVLAAIVVCSLGCLVFLKLVRRNWILNLLGI